MFDILFSLRMDPIEQVSQTSTTTNEAQNHHNKSSDEKVTLELGKATSGQAKSGALLSAFVETYTKENTNQDRQEDKELEKESKLTPVLHQKLSSLVSNQQLSIVNCLESYEKNRQQREYDTVTPNLIVQNSGSNNKNSRDKLESLQKSREEPETASHSGVDNSDLETKATRASCNRQTSIPLGEQQALDAITSIFALIDRVRQKVDQLLLVGPQQSISSGNLNDNYDYNNEAKSSANEKLDKVENFLQKCANHSHRLLHNQMAEIAVSSVEQTLMSIGEQSQIHCNDGADSTLGQSITDNELDTDGSTRSEYSDSIESLPEQIDKTNIILNSNNNDPNISLRSNSSFSDHSHHHHYHHHTINTLNILENLMKQRNELRIIDKQLFEIMSRYLKQFDQQMDIKLLDSTTQVYIDEYKRLLSLHDLYNNNNNNNNNNINSNSKQNLINFNDHDKQNLDLIDLTMFKETKPCNSKTSQNSIQNFNEVQPTSAKDKYNATIRQTESIKLHSPSLNHRKYRLLGGGCLNLTTDQSYGAITGNAKQSGELSPIFANYQPTKADNISPIAHYAYSNNSSIIDQNKITAESQLLEATRHNLSLYQPTYLNQFQTLQKRQQLCGLEGFYEPSIKKFKQSPYDSQQSCITFGLNVSPNNADTYDLAVENQHMQHQQQQLQHNRQQQQQQARQPINQNRYEFFEQDDAHLMNFIQFNQNVSHQTHLSPMIIPGDGLLKADLANYNNDNVLIDYSKVKSINYNEHKMDTFCIQTMASNANQAPQNLSTNQSHSYKKAETLPHTSFCSNNIATNAFHEYKNLSIGHQLSTQETIELVRATFGKEHQLVPMAQKMSYRCHVCGSGFEDRHRLQQHLSIHLNLHPSWFEEKTIKETMAQYESKRGDYLCTICGLRYDTTAEFDKHMQMHGDKPHQCDLCRQDNKLVSFRYYRQLLTHLRSHCFLYSCKFSPDCKQTANRKDYLKLHILKHHLNNKLPEQYTICCH